jgi:hypothetical protein
MWECTKYLLISLKANKIWVESPSHSAGVKSNLWHHGNFLTAVHGPRGFIPSTASWKGFCAQAVDVRGTWSGKMAPPTEVQLPLPSQGNSPSPVASIPGSQADHLLNKCAVQHTHPNILHTHHIPHTIHTPQHTLPTAYTQLPHTYYTHTSHTHTSPHHTTDIPYSMYRHSTTYPTHTRKLKQLFNSYLSWEWP